jgi:hypothetical protein
VALWRHAIGAGAGDGLRRRERARTAGRFGAADGADGRAEAPRERRLRRGGDAFAIGFADHDPLGVAIGPGGALYVTLLRSGGVVRSFPDYGP